MIHHKKGAFSPKDWGLVTLFILFILWVGLFRNPQEKAPPAASRLLEEESTVLSNPSSNASAEEKQRYFDLVAGFAKESKTLDISQCAPKPLALRAKQGTNIIIRNSDTVPRIIAVGQEVKQYIIPARGITEVKVDFGGIGIFGFGCDMFERGVGVIFVIE